MKKSPLLREGVARRRLRKYGIATPRYRLIAVEETADKGLELIVGLVNDGTFGLCIMLGLGGILAEILEDVSFRAVPIERTDAEGMLGELRARRMPDGFRGMKIDKASVVDLLLKVSRLAVDHGDEIDQLDLNPVVANEESATVVDASKAVREFKKDTQNPIPVVFSGGGKVQKRETRKILKLGLPVYSSVERALKLLAFCGRGEEDIMTAAERSHG